MLVLLAPQAVNAQDNGGSRKPGTTATKPPTKKEKKNRPGQSVESTKKNQKERQRKIEKQRQQERQREIDLQRQREEQREWERQRAQQEEKARQEQEQERRRIAERDRIIQSLISNMVYVEGGTFTMGATKEQKKDAEVDEKPKHKVTLASFYICKYEVTQALWVAVMGSNPSDFQGNLQRPVESVSWDDCQVFIKKLNQLTGKSFRLPTEAEWEYAARGGSKSKGYKYAGSNTLGDVAWYNSNCSWQTHPVATKSPNELGLYDMSGNVLEWCQDWYGSYSSGAQTNPTGSTSGSYRVCRGGSWCYGTRECRVSNRIIGSPSHPYYHLGLRLAL